jgi:hypothetical protein
VPDAAGPRSLPGTVGAVWWGLEPGETIEDGLRREVRLGPNRAVIGPGEIVRFCPGMGRVLSTKVSLAFASRQTSFLLPFGREVPTFNGCFRWTPPEELISFAVKGHGWGDSEVALVSRIGVIRKIQR